MDAWLIYDREGAKRNSDYIDYHHEVGLRHGVHFELIFAEDMVSSVLGGRPDFAVVRAIRPDINKMLEDKCIPTFNNSKVSYIANHKGRCISYISEKTDVPVVPTEVITRGDDFRTKLAGKEGYVIKSASGHGGTSVRRVTESEHFYDDTEKLLASDDLILQPFIEGPGEDVRVYVIGKDIIAAVKRRAPKGEFRANASLGGLVERYTLSEKETGYVRQITEVFDFGMVGIDFIVDADGGFVFSEIEDVVGARMLYRTYPEIDILDKYISFLCLACR